MFPLLLFIIGLKLCFKINIDYIELLTVLIFLFASFFDPVFKGGVTGAVNKLYKRGCLFFDGHLYLIAACEYLSLWYFYQMSC